MTEEMDLKAEVEGLLDMVELLSERITNVEKELKKVKHENTELRAKQKDVVATARGTPGAIRYLKMTGKVCMTVGEIASATKRTPGSVRSALNIAAKGGTVVKTRRGGRCYYTHKSTIEAQEDD